MKKITCLTVLALIGSMNLSAQNWQLNQQRGNLELSDMHFLDSQTGFVFGDSVNSGTFITGVVLRTDDGGQTWITLPVGNPNYEITKAHVLNGNEIFAAGRSGGGNTGLFIKSNDGGNTWVSPATFVERLNNVYFIDPTNGWVMGRNGLLSKTSDGGVSWSPQNVTGEDLNCMKFFNSAVGILGCGGGELYRTADGGNSWVPVNSNVADGLMAIAISGQEAWICGEAGTLIYSSDYGQTWAAQTVTLPVDFSTISCPDNTNGWIGGLAGTINSTSDGGTTWQFQNSNTPDEITGLSVPDLNHGWFCTETGDIFKFNNATGLSEDGFDDDPVSFTVYPNPSSEIITVKSFTDKVQRFYITDQAGKIIRQFEITGNGFADMDISGIACGIYSIYEAGTTIESGRQVINFIKN